MERTLPFGFDSPDESPGFLLWQVTNMCQRNQRAALFAVGLTHVQFVLLAGIRRLIRDGAPVTQTELAAYARTHPMMTSQVLRTLEARGLIERAISPEDMRARCLSMTPAGTELLDRAVPLVEQTDAQFFSTLRKGPEPLAKMLRQLLPSD